MFSKQQLIEFLDSDDNLHGLDEISTHGFLVATIVGPNLQDWQNVLFDDNKQSLPDGLLSALETWREDIISEIKETETFNIPAYMGEEDDFELSVDSDLGDWCAGFVDAMYANEKTDWFETASQFDSDEDEIATLTLPMIIYSGVEENDEDLISMREDSPIMEEMANSIAKNSSELYLIYQMPQEK